MRTKTANEIRKILKYLISPDEELMNLGIGLFKDCYLLTQLNKTKIFTVEYKWPGFSSNCPPHFKDIPRYGIELKFTKGQFIKMLSSQSTSIYKKACLILSFVYNKVDYPHSRDYNYNLKYAITKCDNLNHQLVAEKKKLGGAKYYKSYFDPERKQITSQVQNFREEIDELNISPESFNYNRYDQMTPKQLINIYKNYLQNNYKSKSRRKWFKNNIDHLTKIFNISFDDLKLYEKTGLCTSNFYDALYNNKIYIR